jgi:hypothetical protein
MAWDHGGRMSDSYDTNAAPNSAALDIASGDLPGVGNPLGNTEPVAVLEDFPGRTDEGRAMLQIVHDLAPKAKLGFATANTGELGFANNIRALAGDPAAPNFRAGFKADVIVDYIIYLAEPFFQDGVIAQAVDEVVAKGVAYFSSAGNRPATQAYDSKIQIVPATPTSGRHESELLERNPALCGRLPQLRRTARSTSRRTQFTSNPGSSNTVVLQWNEPFDANPPTPIGAPFASGRHGPRRRLRGLHVQRHGGSEGLNLRRRRHGDDRNFDSGHRAGSVQPDRRSAGQQGHRHESRVFRAGTAGHRDLSCPRHVLPGARTVRR